MEGERERLRIRAILIHKFIPMSRVRRDRIRNERTREIVGVRKGVEVINESTVRWYGHTKRMEENGLLKCLRVK